MQSSIRNGARWTPPKWDWGPVHTITPMMQRHGLGLDDLDTLEIMRRSRAQAWGCLRHGSLRRIARRSSALMRPSGKMDRAKFNPDGGAIAVGHPSAHPARVVLHALKTLGTRGGKRTEHRCNALVASRAGRCYWSPLLTVNSGERRMTSKLKHWCGVRGLSGQNTAPVLKFEFRTLHKTAGKTMSQWKHWRL